MKVEATLPHLGNFLDLYLDAYRSFRNDAPQSRTLDEGGVPQARCSKLGACLLEQWMLGKGFPRIRPSDDPESLRTFENGDMVAERLVKMMQRMGLVRYGPEVSNGETYLHDEELNLAGHVDLILGWPPESVEEIPDEVAKDWSSDWIEFLRSLRASVVEWFGPKMPEQMTIIEELKTTHSRSLTYLVKEDAPRFEHWVQAGAYDLLSKRHPEQMPYGKPADLVRVTYVGKDSFGILPFAVGDDAAEEAEKRALMLRDAWASDTEPECTCKGWYVEYCSYSTEVYRNGSTVSFECCGSASYERKLKKGER
jgi:hypothetical protein